MALARRDELGKVSIHGRTILYCLQNPTELGLHPPGTTTGVPNEQPEEENPPNPQDAPWCGILRMEGRIPSELKGQGEHP